MIYVFLADGFEELEALAPVDILRRGNRDVVTVGVTGKTVTGSHNVPVVCDMTVDEIKIDGSVQAIILPGGMPGTLNLEKSGILQKIIEECSKTGRLICAICAAPSILGHKGLLNGKEATCYTGFEKDLEGATVKSQPVVRDGNIITAFGAGAAFQFGFEILSAVSDKETAEKTRKAMRFGE